MAVWESSRRRSESVHDSPERIFVDTFSGQSVSSRGVGTIHLPLHFTGARVSESLDQEIQTLQSIYWSERDPDGMAFAPLADAFLRKGEVREALDLLADGTSRHPDVATGHVVASRLYLEQGMHGEAECATRRVLDLDPGNIVALSTLATILADRGEWNETAKLRGTLIGLDPESEEAGSTPQLDASVADDTTDLSNAASGQLIELVSVEEGGPGSLLDEMTLGDGGAADEDPQLRDALFPLWLSDESVSDAGSVGLSEVLPDPDAVDTEGVSVTDRDAVSPAVPSGVEVGRAGADTDFDNFDSTAAALAGMDDDSVGAVIADTDALDLAALAPEPAADVMDLSLLSPDADPELEEHPDALELGDMAYVPEESSEVGSEAPLHTRTLAELYVKQGFVDRALGVLHSLLEADPDADDLRARIAELEGRPAPADESPARVDSLAPEGGQEADTPADSTDQEASAEEGPGTVVATEEDVETLAIELAEIGNGVDDVDTPFAWSGEEAEASEPDADRGDIGRYFDAILNWTSDN